LLAVTLVLVTSVARAHDPFEITSDAHVSGDRMVVHTTMSLLTAARACLPGASALRIPRPADFEPSRPLYEACARDFYRITSGAAPLPVREVQLGLTV
jgi:hypothetical protein